MAIRKKRSKNKSSIKFIELKREILDRVPMPGWQEIGEGGEALIYDTPEGSIVKIFRHWNDIRYQDDKDQQEAAKERFLEMQTKLLHIPEMPEGVLAPKRLFQTEAGSIFGYEMEKISNPISIDKLWNISSIKEKLLVLRNLFELLKQLHEKDIIVGDLVPRDIFWNKRKKVINICDSDSMQFSGYNCRSFSIGFADPDVLDFNQDEAELTIAKLSSPYTKDSDWFSFYAICMAVLIGIDPYGGTHKSAVTKEDRVKEGITIFSKGVIYPATAKRLNEIPRKLLEAIALTFNGNQRIIPEKSFFK